MTGGRRGPGCPKDCPRRSIQPNCHNVETCEIWAKYVAKREAEQTAKFRVLAAERDLEDIAVRRAIRTAKEARRHR